MAAVTSAEYMGSNGLDADRQIPALMFAMVDANPALADAAGVELGTAVTNDPFYSFNGAFHSAVTSLGISADDTMAVLMGASHAGATWFASEMVVQLYVNHTFNISQEMASIQSHVTTSGLADDAVKLLYGLVNSGYASTYQQPADGAGRHDQQPSDHGHPGRKRSAWICSDSTSRGFDLDGDRGLQRTRCCECGVGGGGRLRAIPRRILCRACARQYGRGQQFCTRPIRRWTHLFSADQFACFHRRDDARRGDRRAH